jgi:hypothetical protein
VIGALDFAADGVGKRLLGNDLGKIRPLARPITEARPEAGALPVLGPRP